MTKIYKSKRAGKWKIKDIVPKSKIPKQYMIKQTIDEIKDYKMLTELTQGSKLNRLKEYFRELDVGIR